MLIPGPALVMLPHTGGTKQPLRLATDHKSLMVSGKAQQGMDQRIQISMR